jgi:hypothetical protein
MGGDYNPLTEAICAIIMDDDAKLENRERFIARAKGSCSKKGIGFNGMPEEVRRLMTDLGGLLLSEGDDAVTVEHAAELLREEYETYKSGYTSTDMRVLLKKYPELFREPLPIVFEKGHFAISQNCLSYHLS